jgi:two-component system sensor histidine kinase EvgS
MIQATLDVSRLEAGRLPLQEAPVDLRTFLSDLRAGIPEYWQKASVSLQWSVADAMPAVILDTAKLTTIVRNLVQNALKFTDAGEVVVRARFDAANLEFPTPDQLVITVSDTGIGIPQEQLGVVFEMFRQADGSDSRRHGGVGLGLYIVSRLAQALGGSVRVDSKPGEGSIFTVTVPVRLKSDGTEMLETAVAS